MTETTSIRVTPRLVVGLAILLAGVIFTLDNLEMVDAGIFLDFWPLVFVAIGVVKLFDSRSSGSPSFVTGGAWILLGAWWTLYNLAIVDIHVFDLWPLLLIFAGYTLIRRGLAPRPTRQATGGDESGEGVPSGTADPELAGVAVLCGLRRNSASNDFQGGDLVAVMGGCEADLRGARIQGDDAVLDTFAFWGGIEIRVPEDWTVISQVTPILGGYEDKTDQRGADPKQRLVIKGIAMMGGIEVRN